LGECVKQDIKKGRPLKKRIGKSAGNKKPIVHVGKMNTFGESVELGRSAEKGHRGEGGRREGRERRGRK